MENLNVREKIEKQGIEMKKPGEVTLESEYEKVKDVRFLIDIKLSFIALF